jgi:hypothetical protein
MGGYYPLIVGPHDWVFVVLTEKYPGAWRPPDGPFDVGIYSGDEIYEFLPAGAVFVKKIGRGQVLKIQSQYGLVAGYINAFKKYILSVE